MYFRQKGPTLCLLVLLRWKITFNLPNTSLKAILTASTVYTLHVFTWRPPFSALKIHAGITFPFSNGIGCCSSTFYLGEAPKSGSVKGGSFPPAFTDSTYSYTVISLKPSCSGDRNNRIGSLKLQWVQLRKQSIVDWQPWMAWKYDYIMRLEGQFG